MSEPTGIPEPGTGSGPDLMGYPSVDALVNAKRASDAEAQRIRARLDATEQQMQALMAANQRQSQPQTAPYDPSAELETLGIPTRALDAYVESKVQSRIAEAFQPIARGFEARGQLLADHPDYLKYEQQVAQFINSDPRTNQAYNEMFRANPVGAMEWAFLRFGENQRRTGGTPPNGAIPEPPTHAAIPTTRQESRRQTNDDDTIRAAHERYMQTGSKQDAYAYAKARLRTVISDDHLNQ